MDFILGIVCGAVGAIALLVVRLRQRRGSQCQSSKSYRLDETREVTPGVTRQPWGLTSDSAVGAHGVTIPASRVR